MHAAQPIIPPHPLPTSLDGRATAASAGRAGLVEVVRVAEFFGARAAWSWGDDAMARLSIAPAHAILRSMGFLI
jgi:hypothetical protein